MSWLFAKHLRPFVPLAGAASLLLNLALLMPAIYMVQVFDRVFASRSVEALIMLDGAGIPGAGAGLRMDTARMCARMGGWAPDRRLSPAALAAVLRARVRTHRPAGHRRAARHRSASRFLQRQWHPGAVRRALVPSVRYRHRLDASAARYICLWSAPASCRVGRAHRERLTPTGAEQSLRGSRAANRQAEALTRHAEAIVGMGMTSAAIASWRIRHDELLDAQAALGATFRGFQRWLAWRDKGCRWRCWPSVPGW